MFFHDHIVVEIDRVLYYRRRGNFVQRYRDAKLAWHEDIQVPKMLPNTYPSSVPPRHDFFVNKNPALLYPPETMKFTYSHMKLAIS